ncbi:MAG TPA: septal ring lytic transglycosylase RlpA family protein [Lysobacter sp.]|nr:septal ring lytic transglycosylase RlpA family protein [Lysobacter sp.]
MRALAVALSPLLLIGCASAPKPAPPSPTTAPPPAPAPASSSTSEAPARKVSPYAPAQEDPAKRGNYRAGGLYAPEQKDSVPSELPDVERIPEPDVVDEPRSRYGNRSPYQVLGRSYHVLDTPRGYVERGLASYYGAKFHGRRTSNLEVYDMYAFTAAHRTLPLPSYARVTNLDNGKSVIVRVNDRGPFHDGRLIDLSFAAAVKIGIYPAGTGRVEVRALTPEDVGNVTARAPTSAAPPADSALDRLVQAMPVASAQAAEPAPRAAPASGDYRFDMRQDGRPMTADEFDAWLKARQVRIATGRPGTPAASPPAPAPAVPLPRAEPSAADAVTLQVASFAARGNADRALALLREAGIDGRVSDAQVNGQQVWRLRVGPLDADAAPALAQRIAGLGFGPPQRVRE